MRISIGDSCYPPSSQAVYDKPMSDKEEDGVFKFDPPGIVFQSVYTMSLYGQRAE